MAAPDIGKEIDECIDLLERDALTAERLTSLKETTTSGQLPAGKLYQDVLYMQTVFSSVTSIVNGISMIVDGEVQEVPEDPEGWPYSSVLEALNDGWRIVSFPNMALMMDDSITYGVGNEFILERISYR